MKENKKFSTLEMEEQVALGSLVLEEEESFGLGELVIDQYLEDAEDEATRELIIDQYLEDAEDEAPGESIIDQYLDGAEDEATRELIIEQYSEDAEEESLGELIIEQYLEDAEEQQQTGLLDELAKEIELAQSVMPEPDQDMAAEVEKTLLSISRTLDQLINETDDYVRQKQQDFEESEFEPMVTQSKKKEPRDYKNTLVPDLYAKREWHLVMNEKDYHDNGEQKYSDSVLPGLPSDKVTEPKPPEKKSLGSLSTALLAGGGVLVFGLVTAGVVTAVKSYREKSQQQPVAVWNESPAIPAIQPVEKEVEKVDPPRQELPEPPPANQYPAAAENMYRAPMPHRPPVIPLFGFGRPCHWKVG